MILKFSVGIGIEIQCRDQCKIIEVQCRILKFSVGIGIEIQCGDQCKINEVQSKDQSRIL